MNTEIENNINERIRLDLSYNNFQTIVKKQLPYKFSYLDEWLLKKSKLLNDEATVLEQKLLNPLDTQTPLFRTYQRGTIVKVDFGIGIGSEMSQIHFAIVLNNYDNPRNNILTVIPLTSKPSKFNTYLGTLIIDMLIERIKNKFKPLKDKIDNDELLTAKENTKLNKLNTLLSYYKSNVKSTFACCSLITTISKERIFLPVNEYDIIGRVKCSNQIMNKLDEEIKNKFTLTFNSK